MPTVFDRQFDAAFTIFEAQDLAGNTTMAADGTSVAVTVNTAQFSPVLSAAGFSVSVAVDNVTLRGPDAVDASNTYFDDQFSGSNTIFGSQYQSIVSGSTFGLTADALATSINIGASVSDFRIKADAVSVDFNVAPSSSDHVFSAEAFSSDCAVPDVSIGRTGRVLFPDNTPIAATVADVAFKRGTVMIAENISTTASVSAAPLGWGHRFYADGYAVDALVHDAFFSTTTEKRMAGDTAFTDAAVSDATLRYRRGVVCDGFSASASFVDVTLIKSVAYRFSADAFSTDAVVEDAGLPWTRFETFQTNPPQSFTMKPKDWRLGLRVSDKNV